MRSTDVTVREMVERRHRRKRTILVSLVAAVVIGGAAVVGVGLVRANDVGPATVPDRVPENVAGDKAGLVRSDGEVAVELYLDFLCPECGRTERVLARALDGLSTAGDVRVVYHPVAFLDGYSSPSGYSTRAAAAAACSADEGKFESYSAVLFESQPPEHGPGHSQARLLELGRDAGIAEESFARCVKAGTYRPWVRFVSDVAAADGVAATPTVVVNGTRVDVTGDDPGGAVAAAVEGGRR